MSKAQTETGSGRRWIALICLFLVVTFASIEATHAHLGSDVTRASGACAICISIHANAAAVTFHLFQTSFVIQALALPAQAENKGIVSDLALFIRPPPSA